MNAFAPNPTVSANSYNLAFSKPLFDGVFLNISERYFQITVFPPSSAAHSVASASFGELLCSSIIGECL